MKLKIKLLDDAAKMPVYSTPGASGADLFAAEDAWVEPVNSSNNFEDGVQQGIRTGIAVEIPPGYEIQIRPRSGLALKSGIHLHFGSVDEDFRGEIKVIIFNLSGTDFRIQKGDRIAQMVLAPVIRAEFEQVDKLSETIRGEDGFGSTGIK